MTQYLGSNGHSATSDVIIWEWLELERQRVVLHGLQWQSGEHRHGRGWIVCTSYPSSSTRGAQHAGLSGRGNDHKDYKRRDWPRGNTLHGKYNRSRASKFRKHNEYQHVTGLIDVDGNQTEVGQGARTYEYQDSWISSPCLDTLYTVVLSKIVCMTRGPSTFLGSQWDRNPC